MSGQETHRKTLTNPVFFHHLWDSLSTALNTVVSWIRIVVWHNPWKRVVAAAVITSIIALEEEPIIKNAIKSHSDWNTLRMLVMVPNFPKNKQVSWPIDLSNKHWIKYYALSPHFCNNHSWLASFLVLRTVFESVSHHINLLTIIHFKHSNLPIKII